MSVSSAPRPELTEFLADARYRLGGRDLRTGIDCLGLTLRVLQRLGISAGDPWRELQRAWVEGRLDTATGFPAGWRRIAIAEIGCDGDVLLFSVHGASAAHVAVVLRGYVLHATEGVGVHARPWNQHHPQPEQAWRYSP